MYPKFGDFEVDTYIIYLFGLLCIEWPGHVNDKILPRTQHTIYKVAQVTLGYAAAYITYIYI